MRTIFITLLLTLSGLSFGQDQGAVKSKTVVGQKPASNYAVLARDKSKTPNIYGDFIIRDYEIIIRKGDSEKVSKNVLGTVIKITESAIAGEQIDPMTYNLSESEMLFSEDYIYRAFEVVIEKEIENIPMSVLVHKTTNGDCYGILELIDGTVVLPYQGMLLFLVRP